MTQERVALYLQDSHDLRDGHMFQLNVEFADAFCAARDLARTRALNPALQSFAQWPAANKGRIPLG